MQINHFNIKKKKEKQAHSLFTSRQNCSVRFCSICLGDFIFQYKTVKDLNHVQQFQFIGPYCHRSTIILISPYCHRTPTIDENTRDF